MTYYVKDVLGNLDQGDILAPVEVRRYLPWWPNDKQYPLAIVTPTCDLALEKANFHRLCILQPFPIFLYQFAERYDLKAAHWEGTEAVSKTKWEQIRKYLDNAVRNALPRFHFLPREDGIFQTDYLIDFELLVTIPLPDLKPEQRHARLTPPYQQELIQRLASHLMRIGTPDHAPALIQRAIECCVSESKLRLSA